ncbi:MAG: TetR/AcrR family transcriptional regulator [Myxococcota bacterium]
MQPSTPGRSTEAPPRRGTEARRAQLLDVARARFIEDGYAGTSVSAIVRAAGVAQGTFYVYFESKQAVLADLRRQVFRHYATALAQTAALDLPADERLVQTVLAMVDVVTEHRDLERVFRQAESAEALERAAVEGRARLAGGAAVFLEQGVRDGLFVVDDPEGVAQLVVTLFDNVLYESIAYARPAPLAQTLAHALPFVLRGVGVPEPRIQSLLSGVDLNRWNA